LSELHGGALVKLCSSGTIAVELALRGLGLTADSEVILGAYDFPGNFRCIEHAGARPVLADVDPQHGCLGVDQLAEAFRPTVKAAIVSHLHSGLAPMKSMMQWASDNQVAIIEDACQSPGALVDGQIAGTWGDIGVLSFGGSKLLTAGRGGALLLKDPVHLQRIRVFADRGNDAYPLSELQAAVILPQLDKLARRNATRQSSVEVLTGRISDLDCLQFVGKTHTADQPSYYKVAWRYNAQLGGWTREEFLGALRAEGVAADEGFRGFARRSPKRCRHAGGLAESKYAASATVLLHHPVLLEPATSIEAAANAIRKVVQGFVRGKG
jgi:dTDP-4-amino-4,6-dideoxygalactose transaminase